MYFRNQISNSRFRTAVRAVNKGDEEKMAEVLYRMHEEDPSLLVEYSKELKQMILFGPGRISFEYDEMADRTQR